VGEYQITDADGLELLTLACQHLDRAEALRQQIDDDGEIVCTKQGPREQPGLCNGLRARAFVVRTRQRLGLDVEAGGPSARQLPQTWRRNIRLSNATFVSASRTVKAYLDEDDGELCRLLGLTPWKISPLDSVGPCVYSGGTGRAMS